MTDRSLSADREQRQATCAHYCPYGSAGTVGPCAHCDLPYAATQRAAGQPQPDLREQSSDEIRRDMLAAISGYAGPVIADLAARWSERWTEDQFIAQWNKSLGDLITAVRREEADAKQAEADNLRAFIERGFDTHMQFGLLNADGTTTMLPCADWCHACKVEKAETERDELRAQLTAAGLVPVDQPPGATVLECSRILFRTHDGSATWTHHSHTWETQPGMTPVWCPGVPTAPKET